MSMSPAELQKLALSKVVCDDLPQTGDPENNGAPWTIGRLIEAGYIDNATYNENSTPQYTFSSPEIAALSGMLNWTLVNFQSNTSTGFAGAAFQDNTSEELVFAFRGTEPVSQFGADITNADLQIALQESLPSQFIEAENFVNSVLNNSQYDDASYSFTGHSLGGALASYMTYVTNTDGIAGVGKSVTFNAPGIAGLLPDNVNPADYNGLVTDHVNQGDIVGEFRADEQLGRTVYQMRP